MLDEQFLKDNNIDVDHGLELLGDIDFYNETMTGFVDEIDNRIKDLTNYKNNNDFENYGILSHSIKSDCKYLGIMFLADIALKHEMAGKNSDLDFINNNFDSFIEEIKKVKDICKKYLGR